MEKAVLKTLAYYDVFDFPLKAWEIHKWLIGKKASLQQVQKALEKLLKKEKIGLSKGYYFLISRKKVVKKRLEKEVVSEKHLKTAKYFGLLFRLIPWVKLVGISGSLSMMGSAKTDDIDLFIITSTNRIWVTRLCLIFLTELTGLRRKRREKLLSATGKICINLILEESNLAQYKKNIYLAHEVLQMRPLWQKDEVYTNFLHSNDWAFNYLPNWRSNIKSQKLKLKNPENYIKKEEVGLLNHLEKLAETLQRKIMESPSGAERIESGALYFHPEDKGKKILEEYKKRISALN